jgi:hypothetical protein
MSSRKKIQRIPRLADSPDLAPSDLFLFGDTKRKPTEHDIPDRQSLTGAIIHISNEIGQKTLMAVFETWINRLEWVIEHEEEYFDQQMKNERKCLKIQ